MVLTTIGLVIVVIGMKIDLWKMRAKLKLHHEFIEFLIGREAKRQGNLARGFGK